MTRLFAIAALGFAVLVPALAAAAPVAADVHPSSQVLIEAGWSRPYGDLTRDYTETDLGFGAGDALELGFRWRYRFSQTVSLSPAFHFVDYRDFKSTDSVVGDYLISASSLRYTLELMMIQGDRRSAVRPFLAFSGGLYRNRAVGFEKDLGASFDESVNTLGFGVRGGARLLGFELSAMYNVSRFSTWRYFQTGQEQDYNWDSFTVRAAWIVPVSGGRSVR